MCVYLTYAVRLSLLLFSLSIYIIRAAKSMTRSVDDDDVDDRKTEEREKREKKKTKFFQNLFFC
jgi:hypothetical protein